MQPGKIGPEKSASLCPRKFSLDGLNQLSSITWGIHSGSHPFFFLAGLQTPDQPFLITEVINVGLGMKVTEFCLTGPAYGLVKSHSAVFYSAI